MRVLKFRFFTPDKRMIDDHEGWVEGIGINEAIAHSHQYGYKIMQFAGLHDKHGKEIYEGDIVSVVQDENFVIGYFNDGACFIGNGVDTGKIRWIECREHFRTTDREINLSTSEIVGNIYEKH